jgi:hypothetical protein
MANDVFTVKNNVKIEFYIPSLTAMTWSVSSWDNATWAGAGDVATWTAVTCDTFDVQTANGIDIEKGIFTQPSRGEATIRLQGADYDPFANYRIRSGTPVRITFQQNPDTNPTSWTTLFQGKVQDFQASYNQQGNNVITVHAVNDMQAWLNTKVASYTIPALTYYPNDVISYLVSTYYGGVYTAPGLPDFYYVAAKTYTNTTVGEIIQDCLTAGLGALFMDRAGTYVYYVSQAMISAGTNYPFFSFSTVHTTASNHICMTGLTLDADSRNLPNEIVATYTGGSQLTLRNQEAYDLYGPISLAATVPIDDATGTQLWLNQIDLTTELRRVKAITFDAASRPGQLWDFTSVDRLFAAQTIKYNLGGISFSENYFVTRQINHITPDGWDITLELWRGI